MSFGWLGMVAAISFLEAPVKFRAPGVSVRIGLGIGRLVFRALNTVEVVLALVLVGCVVLDPPPARVVVPVVVTVAVLVVQLAAVRPRLARRADAVIAGADVPRSRGHHAYVALEIIKVAALAVGGILVLAA